MAVSSGATGLEAAAVSTDADSVSEDDRQVIRDFAGTGVPVLLADGQGVARTRVEA